MSDLMFWLVSLAHFPNCIFISPPYLLFYSKIDSSFEHVWIGTETYL